MSPRGPLLLALLALATLAAATFAPAAVVPSTPAHLFQSAVDGLDRVQQMHSRVLRDLLNMASTQRMASLGPQFRQNFAVESAARSDAAAAANVRTAALSGACQTAVDALRDLFDSNSGNNVVACLVDVTDLSVSTDDFTNRLSNFCTNCKPTAQARIHDVQTQCADSLDDSDVKEQLRAASFLTDVACLKPGSTYCFATLSTIAQSDFTQLNTSALDGICGSDCFLGISQAIQGHYPERSDEFRFYLELFCATEDGSKYCLPEFYTPDGLITFQYSDSIFRLLCSSCVQKYALASTHQSNDSLAWAQSYLSLLDDICKFDGDSMCSLLLLSNSSTLLSNFDTSCPDLSTVTADSHCSGSCKDAINVVSPLAGCCMHVLGYRDIDNLQNIEGFLTQSCGVELGDDCSIVRHDVNFRLALINFSYNFYTNADPSVQQAVHDALISDVSYNTAVPESLISFDHVTTHGSAGTRFYLNIQSNNPLRSQALSAEINLKIMHDNFYLPRLMSEFLSVANTIPTETKFLIDKSHSDSDVTNAASHALGAPSHVAALLVILVASFLAFFH